MRSMALAAALLVASTAGAEPTTEGDLRARAQEAFDAARAHTLKESLDVRLDAVWHIDQLLKIRPDAQLQWWADLRRRIVSDHRTYRMVDPEGPRYPLPREPGHGLEKWYTYMEAPFGRPEDLAVRFIEEYIGPAMAEPESGYVLTHQLAVLEWAEEGGLELPERLTAMKPVLLERIAAEHKRDETFSDLFAERMFFLVIWGDPSDEELERTVRVIVDAQTEPGVWNPPPVTLSYDGESRVTEVEPEHARKMAMVVLAEYLRRTQNRGPRTTAPDSRATDLDPRASDQKPSAEIRGSGIENRAPGAEGRGSRAEDTEESATWLTVWGVLIAVGVLALIFFGLRRFRGP